MPSPFPGMDPYLEERQLWPDVHHRLITAIGDELAAKVAPAYYVRIEQRTYIARADQTERLSRPDVAVIAASDAVPQAERGGVATLAPPATQAVRLPEFERVREAYLEIRDARTHEVVTAIELLSPPNKAAGQGRREYEAKREEVLKSFTSLVEIDLLRGGEPMEMEPLPESDYRIIVSPGWERPWSRLHTFGIRHSIPDVSVPLRHGELEPALFLGNLLAGLYDRARYELSIDYRLPPPDPSLSPDDDSWMNELLRESKRRE
jgi:hypothetical protein